MVILVDENFAIGFENLIVNYKDDVLLLFLESYITFWEVMIIHIKSLE